MKHFKLTANSKVNALGITLFQVELTIDCKFGKKGDLGGWVEKEDNLKGEEAWVYKNASICGDGVIRGGVIRGGVIRGGVIRGGEIRGGVIRGGVIRGGVIRGGVIRGGVIRGGVIRGGVIRGGVIRGGEIRGGVIRGGVIRGGVIRCGDWSKAPLQIQGSRHFVNVCNKFVLRIGCNEFTFEHWKENFKTIGKENGYTAEEITEYGLYINLVIKIYGLKEKE
jgi:hypothetical protein